MQTVSTWLDGPWWHTAVVLTGMWAALLVSGLVIWLIGGSLVGVVMVGCCIPTAFYVIAAWVKAAA